MNNINFYVITFDLINLFLLNKVIKKNFIIYQIYFIMSLGNKFQIPKTKSVIEVDYGKPPFLGKNLPTLMKP